MSIVTLRYALFPSASHTNVRIDAVEVRLGMTGSPSWNLANIPLEFTEAHHKILYTLIPVDARGLEGLTGLFNSRKDRIDVEAGFADPFKYVLSHDLRRDKACLVSTSDLIMPIGSPIRNR